MSDLDAPVSTLRSAVIDGLLIETQVVPMDRETAERVADRIMEGVEARELTVLDRSRVAAWMATTRNEIGPLLALHGRGVGICDVRGYHAMVLAPTEGWPYNVVVCEDCESATQVGRDT